MFLIDDLLFRPLLAILDAIHSVALTELYDVEEIRDRIKENRLLYELGDLSKAEYEERKAALEAELEAARRAHERVGSRIEVKR
ncbi:MULTISPECIES: gas vesicle protein GvpG [unclassified Haladaptatus]|uniref:gas vesicle protein GvpG n=1 Tax=unclassified Haladaptatus TaxID=2622732 RepID=UPI0023E7D728|nr:MULTISPECIES: protein gvpG [unclassified Haladaptatus]